MAPVVQPAKIRVVMLESGERKREWAVSHTWHPLSLTLYFAGLRLPDASPFF